MERLQKILSARGVASRREAEKMIQHGRVTVDGKPAHLGQQADPLHQMIRVDGVPIPGALSERVYIMLYKPRGYVTTVRDDKGRRTVMDLLGRDGHGLWPVGRLDWDSQGLLLMTNDGEVTRRLTHPSFQVEKVYRVRVRGQEFEEKASAMEALRKIDGEPIQPAKTRLLWSEEDAGLIEVRIREGKNRQVRNMCALVGLQVVRLTRVGEGELKLGGLKPGKWRHLTAQEVEYLRSV